MNTSQSIFRLYSLEALIRDLLTRSHLRLAGALLCTTALIAAILRKVAPLSGERISQHLQSIHPVSATAFALTGIALLLLVPQVSPCAVLKNSSNRTHRTASENASGPPFGVFDFRRNLGAQVCALLLILLATSVLLNDVLPLPLWGAPSSPLGFARPLRHLLMNGLKQSSAFCFLLTATAIWLLSAYRPAKLRPLLLTGIGSLILAIGFLTITNLFVALIEDYGWWGPNQMPISNALLFVLIGANFLWSGWQEMSAPWLIGKSMAFTFGSGLFLLGIVSAHSIQSTEELVQITKSTDIAQRLLHTLTNLRSRLEEAQSGVRGYILTGNPSFLALSSRATPLAQRALKDLLILPTQIPSEHSKLTALELPITDSLAFSARLVNLRDTTGISEVLTLMNSEVGNIRMNIIRSDLEALETEQNSNQEALDNRKVKIISKALTIQPFGLLLSVPLLTIGLMRLNTEIHARQIISNALFQSETQLRLALDTAQIGDWIINLQTRNIKRSLRHDKIFGYSEGQPFWNFPLLLNHIHPDDRERVSRSFEDCIVSGKDWTSDFRILRADGREGWVWTMGRIINSNPDGGSEMFGMLRDITEQRNAETQAREWNTSLEHQVQQRTDKLEAAVSDLDAFSYSVSHDLRAPLRAIDGFSRMLLEEYGARLDDEGRRMMGVVLGEAQRMRCLIDDLLVFSRLGRQPLQDVFIDMGTMAQAVFDELIALEPLRKIQLTLKPLPVVNGTAAMIRQVWVNLIGNALKFSRGSTPSEIKIGTTAQTDGTIAYYVQDNGVGFDMRHAGKLFGVFQRLHTEEEFEGTGVGLSLVHRIIIRHGGRIWADSTLNHGATFYFTLPGLRL